MVFFPPAKINIGLRILRKRPDAYHDLELSFFAVPELCDVLEIVPAGQDSFVCDGLPIEGDESQNLILKARNLIDRRMPGQRPPCLIHLLKKIPMGSGLGGGSSDAAYALSGLNATFKLGISAHELREMAAELGADCAFFTQKKACIGYGKGDRLEELPTDSSIQYKLLIVVPDFAISTAQAYRNALPQEGRPALAALLSKDISTWKENIRNDFENTLIPLFPQIERIKQALYENGAIYASLSGSGSAVFGIFRQEYPVPQLNLPETYFKHQSCISIP